MDLLQGKIRPIYMRYLAMAFGSALIVSIYSIVDMAMVGQYQGPEGTAALAVVAPVWNIIYSLGLLTGIGGSVLYSTEKGQARGDGRRQNAYFSAAMVGTAFFALVSWIVICLFSEELLRLFGAQGNLLPLAEAYLLPVKFAIPVFIFNQMLAAFLRNDGSPGLATAAVLGGGIFNVVGDYVLVFTLDMGIFGAGLATAIGATITLLVLLTHFLTKKNTLGLVRPTRLFRKLRQILVTGFSTFFIDIAMGILTMLFNRQIMKYLGTDALAVYGIIVNVSTLVQACAYGIGQAVQPIISVNFGAGQGRRIQETLGYALLSVGGLSLLWTATAMAAPNGVVRIFMDPTPEVLAIAPLIIRSYALSFLLLPLNIFSTYYFQALLKPVASFMISITRGCVLSGGLILLLPRLLGPDVLWFAMPVTELVVFAFVAGLMIRYTRGLDREMGARVPLDR